MNISLETFLQFLTKSKQAIVNAKPYEHVHLVLGNESCDLDSTISSLALAFLIYSQPCCKNSTNLVVPIMNTEAKYFPLRTETCYLLKKSNIDPALLVYKDQINYAKLLQTSTVKTSLVDHHVLSAHDKILEDTVTQIFDHRPINHQEICQSGKTIIKTVGSCCTLITQELIDSKIPILFKELSELLYGTIIYDTIGLDKECGKTFEEDIVAAQHLESILKPSQTRKELFDLLYKVHNDTSNLTTKDLLYRDLKIVSGIPFPGLPLLVEDYLKREDAATAISTFAEEFNSSSVVLIGIDASSGVRRDLAIFSSDPTFTNSLTRILNNSKQIAGTDLCLSEVPTQHPKIVCFRQGNIKLSRKFILPLVARAATDTN